MDEHYDSRFRRYDKPDGFERRVCGCGHQRIQHDFDDGQPGVCWAGGTSGGVCKCKRYRWRDFRREERV